MEGIVNIEKKDEDILRCKKIVATILNELSDEILEAITLEIMDTALFIGGDFSDENIEQLTIQYKDMNGVERFMKNYRG